MYCLTNNSSQYMHTCYVFVMYVQGHQYQYERRLQLQVPFRGPHGPTDIRHRQFRLSQLLPFLSSAFRPGLVVAEQAQSPVILRMRRTSSDRRTNKSPQPIQFQSSRSTVDFVTTEKLCDKISYIFLTAMVNFN